jgi:hypothetical protein
MKPKKLWLINSGFNLVSIILAGSNPGRLALRRYKTCTPGKEDIAFTQTAWRRVMPEKKTIERAKRDKREGNAPSTQAGKFVREAMEHIRQGKHGARSTKQAIAIGLSQARRAGVDLPPPKKGKTSERTHRSAERAYEKGQSGRHEKTNPRRSAAITEALKRESHQAASHAALSRQAKSQARQRTAKERSQIARKAAKTRLAHQTHEERSAIARKAARTRMAKK